MKKYTLFWLDGKSEVVTGNDVSSAFNNAGYGAGAMRALDFYAEGDQRENYIWNSTEHSWKSKSN